MIKLSTIVICTLLTLSCNSGPSQDIDPVFQGHVEDFILEANMRGMNLVLDDIDISVKFGDIDADGQCHFRKNEVTIDRNTWQNIFEPYKKWLMFHELGHCILDRRHLLEQMSNGECKSIMRSEDDSFSCYINFASDIWEDYYLNELFNSEIEIPEWYTQQEDYYSMYIIEDILNVEKVDREFVLDSNNILNIQNFNVDLEFDAENSMEDFYSLSIGNLSVSIRISNTGVKQKVLLKSTNTTLIMHKNENMTTIIEETNVLSIRKKDNYFHFYVNNNHLHTIESELWDNEHLIKSNKLYVPIPIKLNIREIE